MLAALTGAARSGGLLINALVGVTPISASVRLVTVWTGVEQEVTLGVEQEFAWGLGSSVPLGVAVLLHVPS
jgi:hypothetical protein